MPESDITITGKANSDRIDGEGTETSRYVTFDSPSKTIKYTEDYISSQIHFIITGEKITGTDEPSSP